MRSGAESGDLKCGLAHRESDASDESFRSLHDDADSANSMENYEDCCSPNGLPVDKKQNAVASPDECTRSGIPDHCSRGYASCPEDPEVLLTKAEAAKAAGNNLFRLGDFAAAINLYEEALEIAPSDAQQRAIYLANSAACHLALDNWKECVQCCTDALAIDATYIKALRRRMNAYEKLDELDHALADGKQIIEVEPGDVKTRCMVAKWEPVVKERQEKMKEEVLGKLKDLGNSVLGRFGMSLDNFKMDQDPESGGYSIRFQQ